MRDLSGNVGVEGERVGEWELTEARGPMGLRFELPGPHMCSCRRADFINMWGGLFDCAVWDRWDCLRGLSLCTCSCLVSWICEFNSAGISRARGVQHHSDWTPSSDLLARFTYNSLMTAAVMHSDNGEQRQASAISAHMCGVCVCVRHELPKPLDFLCFSFINILFRQECVPAVASRVGVKPFPWALSK